VVDIARAAKSVLLSPAGAQAQRSLRELARALRAEEWREVG